MKIKALKTLTLCAMMMVAPISVMAEEMFDGPEVETTVTLTVSNNIVRISNAEGCTIYIYNIAGTLIDTIRIDSDDKTVSLSKLNKGCYILKVGTVVRKVSVR